MMIVGEAWGEQEELADAPFVGPSGWLLRQIMAKAGAHLDDHYLTNVFNFRPPNNDVEALTGSKSEGFGTAVSPGKYIRREYEPEVQRLWEEVDKVSPNLIYCLGAIAMWALSGRAGIAKTRGYVTKSLRGHKIIGSWHPAAALRNYKLVPILTMDTHKALVEDATPDIKPQQGHLMVPRDIGEAWDFYEEYIKPAEFIVCDIETEAQTITEVGFAVSAEIAICIPLLSRPGQCYWETFLDERETWQLISLICRTKKLIGQNFAYDMKYLWREMGITCPGFVHDTMLMHHSLEPELEKGLGFLASLYTNRPAWKFMRAESKTSKKGD